MKIHSRPHPFEFDPRHTALLAIDLQNDLLHQEGFCCSMPGVDAATVVPDVSHIFTPDYLSASTKS